MLRNENNVNLRMHYHHSHNGYPVQTGRGALLSEYLDRLALVLESSVNQYGRVFAFRLDLRFPELQLSQLFNSNVVVERFFASFKAKIKHNRSKAKELSPYAHDSVVRYVWCREYGRHGVPHYHLVILLNNDAFCTLGKFEMDRDNLFNRLHEAWASALGLSVTNVIGLVELPRNPFYLLRRDDPESIAQFFYRASYLCKADTKQYGDRIHCFGSSRT